MLHAHLCHAPCKIALQGACHSAARRMAQCCKAHATVLQGACHSAARRMPQCCKGHSTLFFPHALHAPGPAWTVDVCGKKGGTLNMGCSSRVFWANGRGQPPSLATASERATERATEGHREGSQRGPQRGPQRGLTERAHSEGRGSQYRPSWRALPWQTGKACHSSGPSLEYIS